MRDLIFYALITAALLYFHASPWAWAILAIGITYAITLTAYTHYRSGE